MYRALMSVTLAAGVFLPGCSKFKKAAGNPEETAEANEPKIAVPTPAVATPPTSPRLAAPGTFFLLRKKSVTTADGVIGFKPGTLVTRQADGSYLAEGRKLEVTPADLTNNLDIAAQIAGQDALRQAALRQTMAAQAATPPPTATPVVPRSAPAATANTASSSSAPSQFTALPATTFGSESPQRLGGGSNLNGSSGLGATHTRVQDGWLWEKDGDGSWRKIKQLR